jgi:methylase of polypeptide subunit release factors
VPVHSKVDFKGGGFITADADVFLSFASDDVFRDVRESFVQLGFNEENVRDRYMMFLSTKTQFVTRFPDGNETSESGLDVLAHLFLGQEDISIESAIRLLGRPLFEELRELQLLQLDDSGVLCRATVRIEPVDDLLICADRISTDVHSKHVYRPWDLSGRLYREIVPVTPCEHLLDVCCGAGDICLNASRNFSRVASGTDINPRAVHFAQFNQKLNGIEGVQFSCGNLFEPVQSSLFDRIVTHPPYVPGLADEALYRAGGVDGEHVSMSLIRQLPQYLSDRGEFYGWFLLSDRLDAPAELRVREALGGDRNEFDIALLVSGETTLVDFFADRVRRSPREMHLVENCRKLGIKKFVNTSLYIRRRRGSQALTLRRKALSWQSLNALGDQMD